MAPCGEVYAKCTQCTKFNRCDRGYSTDDLSWGKRESYFPDLWKIVWERRRKIEKYEEKFNKPSW